MARVLIVDDSTFLREILKRHLSVAPAAISGGCTLLEAATRSDAIRKFQTEHPDLVLLDIVMDESDRDGVEILAEIMRSPTPPRVIMTSAVGQERVIEECLALGASGYILKPFDEQQVLDAVAFALAERSADAVAGR